MLFPEDIYNQEPESDTLTMESPGGEDDNEEGDWSDIDDEEFTEDMCRKEIRN